MTMAVLQPHKFRRGTFVCIFVATAVIVLLACVGGASWVKNAGLAQSSTSSAVTPVQAPSGVGALGRLEPGWKVFRIAPAGTADGARVESLVVEEGDEVQPGTVLAILDTHARRQAALKEAHAHVSVSRAKLALVQAGTKPEDIAAQAALLAKHRASLEYAAAVSQRAEQLFAKQVMSREDYEQRKMDFTTNQALLHQAEKTLAAMQTIRREDVAVAEAELMKARAGVTRAEADLDVSKIMAPIAGRVLKIYTRAGERVGDSGFAEIGDTTAMHAVAEVYERDAPRVKIGQQAKVKVQSLPEDLSGAVVHGGWRVGRRVVLDNDPVKDTDASVVEVRVKLDAASSTRVAGLSYARVEIHIDAPPLSGGD